LGRSANNAVGRTADERSFKQMRVFAYLDPGSGSMLLQMLLGGIAGVAVSIKMFGKRLLRFFTFWRREEDPAEAGPPVSESEKEVA
jgi:hypothetical protein